MMKKYIPVLVASICLIIAALVCAFKAANMPHEVKPTPAATEMEIEATVEPEPETKI